MNEVMLDKMLEDLESERQASAVELSQAKEKFANEMRNGATGRSLDDAINKKPTKREVFSAKLRRIFGI